MQGEDCVTDRHVIKMNTASSNTLNRSNHSNVPSINVRTILKCNLNIQTSEGYELVPFGSGDRPVSSSGGCGGNHSGSAERKSDCSFQYSIHENLSVLLGYLTCFLVCLLFCWSVGWLVIFLPGYSQSVGWLVTWSSASLGIGFQGSGSDPFDAFIMNPVAPDRTRAASCIELHDD
jgi:hypothetical protein